MKNWNSKKVCFALVAVTLAFSVRAMPSGAADFYFGNFDDLPSYTLVNSYTDPNRTGWFDPGTTAVSPVSTSTTIGVTTGTQSLAWQPGAVNTYNGIAYKVQIAPLTVAERNAIVEGFLANTHIAMNVTWDRNEWIAQHNGDINSNNYSLISNMIINYGPSGAFSQQGAPDLDTGNNNFPGGWDPVNYTTATHTRIVMWDYSALKPAIQALYNDGTPETGMTGQHGWLEFMLSTNAATGDPGYNYPVKYYLDSWRFTTPLEGDFNANGKVDAADYVLWRNGGPLQNDFSPGVTEADFTNWRSRFGNPDPGAGGGGFEVGSIPEPSALLLVLTVLSALCLQRGRQ